MSHRRFSVVATIFPMIALPVALLAALVIAPKAEEPPRARSIRTVSFEPQLMRAKSVEEQSRRVWKEALADYPQSEVASIPTTTMPPMTTTTHYHQTSTTTQPSQKSTKPSEPDITARDTIPEESLEGTSSHLESIAQCESGGDPSAVSSSGAYRGKYQFSPSTWKSVGGEGDPAVASEAEQDKRAQILYNRSGSGQWPVCQHR